jgi:hypothetical protein
MAKAKQTSESYLDHLDEQLTAEQEKFREAYPNFAAAIDAWQGAGNQEKPAAIRITAKEDGFRRAGMAHSGTVDHPVETFGSLELLEQLFAEPRLKVELVAAAPAEKPDADPQAKFSRGAPRGRPGRRPWRPKPSDGGEPERDRREQRQEFCEVRGSLR